MVDSERPKQNFTKNKMKKRKRRIAGKEQEEELQRPRKSSRLNSSEQLVEAEERKAELNVEGGSPWRNLQLILSLQSKNIDIPTKIDLAFNYVTSRTLEEEDDRSPETVSLSRVLVFINNWIQTVLVSSVKKFKEEECKAEQETKCFCLDYRCWVVFKFCLEKSLKLNASLTIQRDFLKVMHFVARNILSHLNAEAFNSEGAVLIIERPEFQDIVLNSILLIFSSHGGVLDENLDLWIMLMDVILKLLSEVIRHKLDDNRAGIFVLQLSSYLVEPFAKFLRIHPTRKNSFGDFIDRLLEPLIYLLDKLNDFKCFKNPGLSKTLLKLVQEVLAQGLFHTTHIEGFLNLQSTSKYKTSNDEKPKDGIPIIKSYHRHLFDKLQKLIARNTMLSLTGMGELVRLFVCCVMKQKGGLNVRGGSQHLESRLNDHNSERSYVSNNFIADKQSKSGAKDAERQISIFDFFVQVMECFLFQIRTYLQVELGDGNILEDVLCVFRCTNKILNSFKEENVYLRTEDISQGACINFLRFIYETVTSFAAKVNDIFVSSFNLNKELRKEKMVLLMKELVFAVNCLLDIEYEVVGDNLESLWGVMLSFSACSHSLMDVRECHVLTLEILHLGCHLIDLYKELRQVSTSIFALCKAVRLLVLPLRDREACYSSICYSYTYSLSMFLCSLEFRSSLCNAIKSIPEGQASGCIRQLTADISESLEWLNLQSEPARTNDSSKQNCNSLFQLHLQPELLARGLSEVYTLILDSITVTTGNSTPVGVSVKGLMALISNCSSALDSPNSERKCEFFSIISGKASSTVSGLETRSLSQWLLVFFFRLYLSCRCLYRQVISLVNPDASRKMSEAMADNCTAYSGKDWLKGFGDKADGYFSWIIQPSASLLEITETVSNIYLQDTLIRCPPLLYLLIAMALQGLVDLNRKIKSIKYLLGTSEKIFSTKTVDESVVRMHHKRNRKWTKNLLALEREATGLTKFIMAYVLPLVKEQLCLCSSKDGSQRNLSVQNREATGWNLSVGTLDEKSLPSALWLIICQNIDLWCANAAKKDLKKFLKLLIQWYPPCITCTVSDSGLNCMDRLSHPKELNIHLISRQLLQDTILYEQEFVCRHMASSFHKTLKTSLSSIFPNLDEIHLDSHPNWSEVIHVLETSSSHVFRDKHAKNKHAFQMKPSSQSLLRTTIYSCYKEDLAPSSINFSSCHSLLDLLNSMPKGYLSTKSLSVLLICVLNIERIIVGSLLGWHNTPPLQNHHEILRLFLSCRRTLKNLLIVSADEKRDDYYSSLICTLSESPFSILWLVKSLEVVIVSQRSLVEQINSQADDMLFSLMDHTSYMFLTIAKYELKQALQSSQKDFEGKLFTGGNKHMIGSESHSNSSDHDSWGSLTRIAENLRKHMQNSLTLFKAAYDSEKVVFSTGFQELNKLSPLISCVQGYLWGLASELETSGVKSFAGRIRLAKSEAEPLYKLRVCIGECTEFVNYFLQLVLVKDNMSLYCQPSAESSDMSKSAHELGAVEALCKVNANVNDDFDEEVVLDSGLLENPSASPDINGESKIEDGVVKEKFRPHTSDIETLLSKVQFFDPQCLKKSLLQGFLRGQNPEVAYFLRHLFFASSAILRLKFQNNCSPSLQSLIAVLVGISEVLLFEFGSKFGESPFSFVWLDGVMKFLEELGSWFSSYNPVLSRNLYVKIVDLHLRAIGKCLVLQGRRANLVGKESESSNNNRPSGWSNISTSALSYETGCIDKLKAKLRKSFTVLIQKASILHMLAAIQAIERAVVGVEETCISNYEISTDISNGGSVSLTVAAAIDCLDLVLEFVKGPKRLNVVRRHIQNLVASLFNIILHLQGPYIFFRNVSSGKSRIGPDSGSVILMCIEVLTTICRKHASFQTDSCHIVQALHLPAALFQNYLQLQQSEALDQCKSLTVSDNGNSDSRASTNSIIWDQQYSVDLYAACCRLLCTIVKHHKSETQWCAAILEDTVNVLLHCLEMVNMDPVVWKDNFAWETQRGVKCACCLRRVYEELNQQKDSFGRYCIQFLSCYIWVYCGYGPFKAGISREVDEALRPGVYALIDACSTDDLQYLHSVFGEGPCRSTLGTLQNDYKLNFQYEGKV